MDIVKTELLDIGFHGLSVVLIVFNRDDVPFGGDQCCFNSDAFSADDADGVIGIDMDLIQDDGADLASYIPNGTSGEAAVPHTDLVSGTGFGVHDQHTGGGVDASVDHVLQLIIFNGAGGIGAVIVPNGTFAQTYVPHAIEDLLVAGFGENQSGGIGFYGGDQVLIFSGDVQDLDFF